MVRAGNICDIYMGDFLCVFSDLILSPVGTGYSRAYLDLLESESVYSRLCQRPAYKEKIYPAHIFTGLSSW